MEVNISKKELEELRRGLKFRDLIIFEKSIYAFRLLQGLLKVYPDLIFKGGTSILLHKFPPIRFSIDVDIILNPKNKNLLEEKLKGVALEIGFKEVEEDNRQTEKNIPKKHLKFYYTSFYTNIRQYILLDIVFYKSPYAKLIKKSLSECPLAFGSPLKVIIPTVEGLFGDKLTTISPNTVGIPLNTKEMEFVKQIIDLGFLLEFLEDFEDVRETFNNTVKFESSFRAARFSTKKVIDNILDVAFKYCQYLLKGGNNSYKEIMHINNGLRRVSNHLLIKYTQSDLKIAFSKIAYICKLFTVNQKPKLLKTVDYKLIENKRLAEKYCVLEGLKKTNPQGYFYWIQAFGKEGKI
jgi:predicted nucleotidyltransferase component of viral defense system